MYVFCNFLVLISEEKLFGPPLFGDGDATVYLLIPLSRQRNNGSPISNNIKFAPSTERLTIASIVSASTMSLKLII